MSFRKKLIALTLSSALLPLILLILYYQIASLQQDWLKSLSYSVDQTALLLGNERKSIQVAAEAFCENPIVQGFLSTPPSQQTKNDQIDEYGTLNRLVLPYYKNDTIYALRVFIAEDKFYLSEQITFFPLEGQPLPAAPSVSGSVSAPYRQRYKNRAAEEVVSYVKPIPAKNSVNKMAGALVIDVRAAALKESLDSLKGDEFSYVGLIRQDGETLLSLCDDGCSPPLPPESGTGYEPENRVFLRRIENTDWSLICQLKSNVRGLLFPLSANELWIGLTLLLFTALSAGFIFSRLAVPIGSLIELFQPSHKAGASSMLKDIRSSVEGAEQVLAERQRQIILRQKMQLSLLQAQLNPHFLYNILDRINWLIRAGRNDSASEMILSTARYYRLALSKGNDEISVRDDLELALAFLKIHNIRAEHPFQIHYILEEEAADCLVPKMTIQPIVENCVRHGFPTDHPSAQISMDIYTEEDQLFISVTDNGVGVEPSKIPEILHTHTSGAGFGLFSVKQRLQLFSENGLGDIQIETEKNKYTTVTLSLSAKRRL